MFRNCCYCEIAVTMTIREQHVTLDSFQIFSPLPVARWKRYILLPEPQPSNTRGLTYGAGRIGDRARVRVFECLCVCVCAYPRIYHIIRNIPVRISPPRSTCGLLWWLSHGVSQYIYRYRSLSGRRSTLNYSCVCVCFSFDGYIISRTYKPGSGRL